MEILRRHFFAGNFPRPIGFELAGRRAFARSGFYRFCQRKTRSTETEKVVARPTFFLIKFSAVLMLTFFFGHWLRKRTYVTALIKGVLGSGLSAPCCNGHETARMGGVLKWVAALVAVGGRMVFLFALDLPEDKDPNLDLAELKKFGHLESHHAEEKRGPKVGRGTPAPIHRDLQGPVLHLVEWNWLCLMQVPGWTTPKTSRWWITCSPRAESRTGSLLAVFMNSWIPSLIFLGLFWSAWGGALSSKAGGDGLYLINEAGGRSGHRLGLWARSRGRTRPAHNSTRRYNIQASGFNGRLIFPTQNAAPDEAVNGWHNSGLASPRCSRK